MEAGVRYQFYATTDGYVLFMASEREFWKNFCEGVGRTDLFERRRDLMASWSKYALSKPADVVAIRA